MKKNLLVIIFVALIAVIFLTRNNGTIHPSAGGTLIDATMLDSVKDLPLGTIFVRQLGEKEKVNHSVMMIATFKEDGRTCLALLTRPANGNIDFMVPTSVGSLDSVPIANMMQYGNITIAHMGNMVINYAPHHALAGLTRYGDIEATFRKCGWERIAKTDIMLSFDTSLSAGYSNIPEVAYAEGALGEQVELEGVQLSRDSSATTLVKMKGNLFRMPNGLRKTVAYNNTVSSLYGMKMPSTGSDSTFFGGLSGSPISWKGKVVGTLLGHLIVRTGDKPEYVLLLIQPSVSPDMLNKT